MDEGFTMVTGPARDAQLLEVGVVESSDGDMLVIHAMPARGAGGGLTRGWPL